MQPTNHAIVLARGRETLEELFPGLTGDLIQRGAVTNDLQARTRWVNEGHQLRQAPSGLLGIAVGRPLLEGLVRGRVAGLHNVTFVERCDVTGLTADEHTGRVTGTRVRDRDSGDVRTLLADLVVDASGRGSPSPTWLAALGYPKPACDEVQVEVTYTTRLYRRAPEHLGGDAAPLDHNGYLVFAASLASRDIAEVIRDAEPLGEPVPAHFASSLRRRYERLDRFPDGYLVFGDAICSFNPIYGQGMTVAAWEAMTLRQCLQRGTEGLAVRFFRRVAKALDSPWDIAVGGDLRIPRWWATVRRACG